MALQPLSIGDILMLSQTAWKIGRAFTQGKYSAPAEFAEVEREANGLSDALKLVAETLHADGSILSQAEGETKNAVNAILESARRSLEDLESFVDRYQVIKKKETGYGFLVERSWSEVVIANYKTFKWTTEGGDITALRNILQVHTNSIQLTMQALQSRSLARLEKTVMPMAENIANIHDRVNGDLSGKIDDMHHIIMHIANSPPSLVAKDKRIEGSGDAWRSSSTISTLEEHSPVQSQRMALPPPPPPRSPIQMITPYSATNHPQASLANVPIRNNAGASVRSAREDSAYYSAGPLPHDQQKAMDWDFETGSPGDVRVGIADSDEADVCASPNDSGYSPSLSRKASTLRESTALPALSRTIEDPYDVVSGSSQDVDNLNLSESNLPPKSRCLSRRSSKRASLLPPPSIQLESDPSLPAPATPSSVFSRLERTKSNFDERDTWPHRARLVARSAHRSTIHSYREKPKFEKQLFRNAAILCDVRGKLVEYAKFKADEPDPRFQVEMLEACRESRVLVMRKRENREHGGTRVVTSIWCLSDDGEVRLQQKLSETEETVPYCSYFDPEKVSLQPTDKDEISLKLHPTEWGSMLKDEIKTNWVNYIFVSENDAVAFQSAIFGRMLVGSYRTTKTTVIHEGLKGAFAFEEQFANIEMLRLWEDDGVSTPGAAGGVMALMHISSNFGEGWAKWWINSSKQHVKVKEDGSKHAKVKGIDITVVRPGTWAMHAERVRTASFTSDEQPRAPVKNGVLKKVNGIRIEFKNEEERSRFVSAMKRYQERPIPLPSL